MIRFLTAALFLAGLNLALVSCSTPPASDDNADAAAPIEDADINAGGEATSADAPAETADAAAPSGDASASAGASASDDLDAEFDKTADAPATGEQKLEDEIAGDDLDKAKAPDDANAQPPPDAASPVPDQPPAAAADASGDTAATPIPTPEPGAGQSEDKAKVRDIRFVANSNGGSVVIETSKPVQYQTRMNAETQQFVIELAGVELPANLQRPYPTQDFNSRIGGINAYQTAGSDTARIVLQMTGGAGAEPVVQQEGAALVVVPPAGGAAATATAAADPNEAKPSEPGQALQARTLDEFLTGNQKFYGRLISLQVKDADVRDVVNFLAEESGANIVMSDDVKGHISLKVRRVPWDQALVTVMRTKELGYVRQGNVLRISTLKALQSESEAANRILEANKALTPAVVQVIPISYASMDEITKSMQPFLSKDGKVVSDNRTNTLIVTDRIEVVERLQKIVKTLDIPPAQVSIESKIVEAQEDFASFAGVNWSFSGADVTLSNSGGAQGAPVNLNVNSHSASLSQQFQNGGPFTMGLNIGTLDVFGDLSAILSLAESDQLAKVISAPRISSMNREKSTIMQAGEAISIITTRDNLTNTLSKSEKRTPFSLELNVTPQITSDGSVIMDLDVKREFLGAVVDAETQSRPVNKRQAKTKILVHNGQTAVIGGIYTSDELAATNGIPGLMRIPILGWLFKNRSVNRTKNELLVFLTPRILASEDQRLQASAQ